MAADTRGDPGHQRFQSRSIACVEPGDKRTVQIKDTDQFTLMHDGHYDFRGAGAVAGDMSGEGADIIHKLRLPRLRRRAANALAQRYADAGGLPLTRDRKSVE